MPKKKYFVLIIDILERRAKREFKLAVMRRQRNRLPSQNNYTQKDLYELLEELKAPDDVDHALLVLGEIVKRFLYSRHSKRRRCAVCLIKGVHGWLRERELIE